MFKERLKSLKNITVTGYLHRAAHRSFRVPFMVTPTKQSPYVTSEIDEKATQVSICLAYPDVETGKINLVLTDGAIFPTYSKFARNDWLTPISVIPTTRSEEEEISWYVHDLLVKAGRL